MSGCTHPLLARGVYTQAAPARRRRSHRALADVVTQPELRARHLALATSSPEPGTLEALDAAAKAARARGAPAAAAELLDLAIKLGGATPARRMKAAEHHIRAGDTRRALEVLDPAIKQLPPGPKRAGARLVRAAILINTEGNGPAADVLKLALEDAKDNPLILVPVRLMLSFALTHLGRYDEALHHAAQARTEIDGLPIPSLVSSVRANWVLVSFTCGLEFDRASMERALELEDFQTEIPISFRASAVNAAHVDVDGSIGRVRGPDGRRPQAPPRTRRRHRNVLRVAEFDVAEPHARVLPRSRRGRHGLL